MGQLDTYDKLKKLITDFLSCSDFTTAVYLKITAQPMSENDLYAYFKVAPDILTESLAFLLSNCLISKYSDRKHITTYFSVNPKSAFSALLLSRMWDVDSSLHSFKDLSLRIELVELNKQFETCNQIIEQIQVLYKKQLPFLREMAVVVSGSKKIASCLSELIEMANEEILAMVSPPHLLGEIIWNTMVDKMAKGVSYYRITTFNELPYHGYVIFKNEILNYNETLYISETSQLAYKFYIIDNSIVVIFVPDIKQDGFKNEVQVISNSGFVKNYKNIYQNLKKSTTDLRELMDAISRFRKFFLNKASDILEGEELKWIEEVFDYGVFCKHERYPTDIYQRAKKKSMNAELISIDANNNIIANYSLEEVKSYGNQ